MRRSSSQACSVMLAMIATSPFSPSSLLRIEACSYSHGRMVKSAAGIVSSTPARRPASLVSMSASRLGMLSHVIADTRCTLRPSVRLSAAAWRIFLPFSSRRSILFHISTTRPEPWACHTFPTPSSRCRRNPAPGARQGGRSHGVPRNGRLPGCVVNRWRSARAFLPVLKVRIHGRTIHRQKPDIAQNPGWLACLPPAKRAGL
jgi:hypothetical protein